MDKYDILKNNLEKYGLLLLTKKEDFKTVEQTIIISDGHYKAAIQAKDYIYNKKEKIPKWFSVKNPFIIENINEYLNIRKNGNFKCISKREDIVSSDTILEFECIRCGTIIKKSLTNLRRDNATHKGISCPNCDDTLESLHALVLKQIFKHYYPDSIEEEPSCINPNTGRPMPTDIVNHRLKIAIEIQGQWHKYEKQKERDRIKKEYWINRGYTFYDYEIEGVSILEYIQYFFPDIEEIPDWVKMDYNKKLNLVEIQNKLDSGMKVQAIASELLISPHRIYDALHYNKLHYPSEYIKSTRRPIIMFDMHRNYQKEYNSYSDAARDNNIDVSGILSAVYTKNYYSNEHFWVPKDLYESGNYIIPENRLEKFYYPVKKINKENITIAVYENMLQAAKDNNTIAYKIHEAVNNKNKIIDGYRFEYN